MNTDFTDLISRQRKTGGFDLVRLPGKAHTQIMDAFNYIQQALWFAAIEIAARQPGDFEDDLFLGDWAASILEGVDES